MIIYQWREKNQLWNVTFGAKFKIKINLVYLFLALKSVFLKILNNPKNKLNSDGHLPLTLGWDTPLTFSDQAYLFSRVEVTYSKHSLIFFRFLK